MMFIYLFEMGIQLYELFYVTWAFFSQPLNQQIIIYQMSFDIKTHSVS